MFQQEIDTLRRKSSSFEGQTSKKIFELSSKVKQLELEKELHTERESNLKNVESLQEELKKQVSSLQHELDESRRTNSFLREELLEMDQKYRNIDSEQDEEL